MAEQNAEAQTVTVKVDGIFGFFLFSQSDRHTTQSHTLQKKYKNAEEI